MVVSGPVELVVVDGVDGLVVATLRLDRETAHVVAHHHAQVVDVHALDAMRGSKHVSVTDKSATAVEVALVHQRHHPRVLVDLGPAPPHQAHLPVGEAAGLDLIAVSGADDVIRYSCFSSS